MSSSDLLVTDSLELKVPFELKKQISCSIHLSNKNDTPIAIKVLTTSPKKYSTRPNTGIVLPGSSCDAIVTMQAQCKAPPDKQSKETILVQNVKAPTGITLTDVTPEMFTEDSSNMVEEVKLRVVFVSPPQPPPVNVVSEKESSSNASLPDNGTSSMETGNATRATFEPEEKFAEAITLISRLIKEKNAEIQQNNKLRQELALLREKRCEQSGDHLTIFFMFIISIVIVFLCVILIIVERPVNTP